VISGNNLPLPTAYIHTFLVKDVHKLVNALASVCTVVQLEI